MNLRPSETRMPEPSSDFLFFQPSIVFERLYMPSFYVLGTGIILYYLFLIFSNVFLTDVAFWIGLSLSVVLSSPFTIHALNVFWAYEGNFTRYPKRPHPRFFGGSRFAFVARNAVLCLLFLSLFFVPFHYILPRAILRTTGEPVTRELLVIDKHARRNRTAASCEQGVDAASAGLRNNYLCLDSLAEYDSISIGDTVIVEGKANWIGLLVDSPIAIRSGVTGRERPIAGGQGNRHF